MNFTNPAEMIPVLGPRSPLASGQSPCALDGPRWRPRPGRLPAASPARPAPPPSVPRHASRAPDARRGSLRASFRARGPRRAASAASAPGSAATAPAAFERRLDLRRASDASGVTPMLLLPQAFGEIYLGETLSCYVSVGNHSRATARDVGIKCELHTERQRVVLRDDTARPIARLQPGESRDFVVEHDLKELGAHTLVCSAVYTDGGEPGLGGGERQFAPQYFKFSAGNPLAVRTKVRAGAPNRTLLEACVENATKHPLFLSEARFDAVPGLVCERVDPPTTSNRGGVLGDASLDPGAAGVGLLRRRRARSARARARGRVRALPVRAQEGRERTRGGGGGAREAGDSVAGPWRGDGEAADAADRGAEPRRVGGGGAPRAGRAGAPGDAGDAPDASVRGAEPNRGADERARARRDGRLRPRGPAAIALEPGGRRAGRGGGRARRRARSGWRWTGRGRSRSG